MYEVFGMRTPWVHSLVTREDRDKVLAAVHCPPELRRLALDAYERRTSGRLVTTSAAPSSEELQARAGQLEAQLDQERRDRVAKIGAQIRSDSEAEDDRDDVDNEDIIAAFGDVPEEYAGMIRRENGSYCAYMVTESGDIAQYDFSLDDEDRVIVDWSSRRVLKDVSEGSSVRSRLGEAYYTAAKAMDLRRLRRAARGF